MLLYHTTWATVSLFVAILLIAIDLKSSRNNIASNL